MHLAADHLVVSGYGVDCTRPFAGITFAPRMGMADSFTVPAGASVSCDT